MWAGVDYEVTTHYFAASVEGAFELTIAPVIDANYNLGALWLPTEEALAAMAIHPAIASAVSRLLRRG